MNSFFLYVNAFLYAALAVWCSVGPSKTAIALGFTQRNSSGQSEYLVIYGGLQLGLALTFAFFGYHAETLARTGLIFAILLYAPIVLYRIVTVIRYWPASGLTVGTAGLEIALFVWGLALYLKSRA